VGQTQEESEQTMVRRIRKQGAMALRACPCQQANCTLIARTGPWLAVDRATAPMLSGVTWRFIVERVTRIELALSAWESVWPPQFSAAELGIRVPASDRG
jgi:hypothetical protein